MAYEKGMIHRKQNAENKLPVGTKAHFCAVKNRDALQLFKHAL